LCPQNIEAKFSPDKLLLQKLLHVRQIVRQAPHRQATLPDEILAIFAYAFLHCCQLRCQLNLEHSQATKDRNQTANSFRLWAMHDTKVAVEKRSYGGSIKIPQRDLLFL
jgi:hypothetical protein